MALPSAGAIYFFAPDKWGRIAFYVLMALIIADFAWLLVTGAMSVAALDDDARLTSKLSETLAEHAEHEKPRFNHGAGGQ
jgi:hypothetical protein